MAQTTRASIVVLALHEAFAGLATGLGGAILATIIIGSTKLEEGLYGSVLSSLIAGFTCMLAGIGIVGYRYLRKYGRQLNFIKHLLHALLGMFSGFAALVVSVCLFNHFQVSHALVNTTVVVLPLLGLLIGFNHRIRYDL